MAKITSDHFTARWADTLAEAKQFAAKISKRHPKISKAKKGYVIVYDK